MRVYCALSESVAQAEGGPLFPADATYREVGIHDLVKLIRVRKELHDAFAIVNDIVYSDLDKPFV